MVYLLTKTAHSKQLIERFEIVFLPILKYAMLINYEDFEKPEIRTGTILNAEPFPEAKKPAWKLTIDFGAAGILNSSAQITTYYSAEDLVGKQIVAVLNFPPKQIANFISQCLVLGAVQADGSVVLLQTERKTDNGLLIR